MKKFWLYAKLAGVFVVLAASLVLYFTLKKPIPTPPLLEEDPEMPEPEEATDFLSKLQKRRKAIKDEIDQLSRSDLVDDANQRYD